MGRQPAGRRRQVRPLELRDEGIVEVNEKAALSSLGKATPLVRHAKTIHFQHSVHTGATVALEPNSRCLRRSVFLCKRLATPAPAGCECPQ